MSHAKPSPNSTEALILRLDELEIRTVFLEDTVDTLNLQLSQLSQEFSLAKQALQMLHQRLEQLQISQPNSDEVGVEAPPPHY